MGGWHEQGSRKLLEATWPTAPLHPFYRWGSRVPEGSSNLHRVTQLPSEQKDSIFHNCYHKAFSVQASTLHKKHSPTQRIYSGNHVLQTSKPWEFSNHQASKKTQCADSPRAFIWQALLSDYSPPGTVLGWEDSRVNLNWSPCLREEPKGCPWDKDQSVENKFGTFSTSSPPLTKTSKSKLTAEKTIAKKMLEPTKNDTLQFIQVWL